MQPNEVADQHSGAPTDVHLEGRDVDKLVGRDQELRILLRALEATSGASGGIVLLSGEPGVGKTRLARGVVTQAVASGFRALAGYCLEPYQGIPFFPFTEALAETLARGNAVREASTSSVSPELSFLVVGHETVSRPDDRSPLRMFRALTTVLRQLAAERPTLLLLEDLHWADSASVGALLYLVKHLRGARLIVLGTYRDVDIGPQHPLAKVLEEITRDDLLEEIAVRPFSSAPTGELIQTRLGIPAAKEVVELVQNHTGGNPLFIQELLKALVERGILDPDTGRWTRTSTPDVNLPRSVRAIVRQRVRRLPNGADELVHLASVLGSVFDLSHLVAASGRPESEVIDNLDTAISARLLEAPEHGSARSFRFRHQLLQQATYEDLSARRRRELHSRVADALERSLGTRPDARVDLARHLIGAGEHERAIAYLTLAGDHAAALYAHAEAAHHYQMALELVLERGQDAAAADLRRKLGSVLDDLNRPTDAIAAYEAALAYYEGLTDPIEQARVHRDIAWIHQRRYDFDAAQPHLETALRLWSTGPQDHEFARLLFDAARAYAYLTEFSIAERLVERGLTLAETLCDDALQARGLLESSMLQRNQGAPAGVSVSLLDRSEALAERAGDRRTLSRLHAARAMTSFFAGRLVGAKSEYQREVQAAERAGLLERVAFAASMVALTCMELGDWAEGRVAGRTARAADAHPPWDFVLPWLEGDFIGALKAAEATLWNARARRDLQAILRCLTQIADWNLQLERNTAALTLARDAVDTLLKHGYLAWVAAAYGPLAEAAVRVGVRDADAVLAEAESRIREHEQNYALPHLLRARGLLMERRGSRRAALEALMESAHVARQQQALPQVARTLVETTRIASEVGRQELAAASEIERSETLVRIGAEVGGLPWAALLGSSERAASKGPGRPRTTGLSPRELEIAELVAAGCTNREIAETLVLTERTVGNHVERIFNKLSLRSRAQLATWTVEHAPHRPGST